MPIFKNLGVTMVIRLNKKAYEASRFTKNGIKHVDLYFLDGSCPPEVSLITLSYVLGIHSFLIITFDTYCIYLDYVVGLM